MTEIRNPGYVDRQTVTLIARFASGYEERQTLVVQIIDDCHVRMMESSGVFSDYNLLFGDRIAVKRLAENIFEVEGPILPSDYRHFEPRTSPPQAVYSHILHELGGGWEFELMVGRIHIPANQIDALMARTDGYDLRQQPEIFSGVVDWGDV